MNRLEASTSTSSQQATQSSTKRLDSLPILSLARRSSNPTGATASPSKRPIMPSSASASSASSASSSSGSSVPPAKDTDQQHQQQQQNVKASNTQATPSQLLPPPQPALPVPHPLITLHHTCTYLSDAAKEFDDVVFDILKVDPDEIAVRIYSLLCSFN